MSAFAIPLIAIFLTIFAGYKNENGKWQLICVLMVLSVFNLWIMKHKYSASIFLFTVSLWIRHLIYMFSQAFLIKIIIGSFPA